MTKRITKSFIVVLVSLCLLLAAIALSFATTETVKADGEGTPAPSATYKLGVASVTDTEKGFDYDESTKTYSYLKHAAGWTAAVAKSKELVADKLVKVVLESNWTAAPVVEKGYPYLGANETDNNSFINGMIRVPSSTDILIDLNGKIIDRKLSDLSTGISWGVCIFAEGNLTITDTSSEKTGKITGANSKNTNTLGAITSTGGGIDVRSGSNVVLAGGAITGNKTAGNGAGVLVEGGGKFTMTGGEISYNVAGTYGGGIYLFTNAVAEIKGGEIKVNTADRGAGIGTLGKVTMTGGSIVENSVVSQGAGIGGGLYGSGSCDFTMTGGEISRNNVSAMGQIYGGGLAFLSGKFMLDGNAKIKSNMALGLGGSQIAGGAIFAQDTVGVIKGNTIISYNEAAVTSSANILGSALFLTQSKPDATLVTLDGNAEISYNKAYRQKTSAAKEMVDNTYGTVGVSSGRFVMNGGKIKNNLIGQGSGIEVFKDGKRTDGLYSCELNGGEITDNLASNMWAIHYAKEVPIKIGGDLIVKNNYGVKENRKFAAKENYTYNNGGVTCEFYQTAMTVYSSNLRVNSNTDHDFDLVVGKLTKDVADIHINIDTVKAGFTTASYGENNSVAVKYDKTTEHNVLLDPAAYFKSDIGYAMVLDSSGKVVEMPYAPEFSTGYSAASSTVAVSGYYATYSYAPGSKLATALSYNGAAVPVTVKKGNADVSADITDAGVYNVVATIDGVGVTYTVIIKPLDVETLTGVEVNLTQVGSSKDTYQHEYGQSCTPKIESVEYGDPKAVIPATDYIVVYGDNAAVGTAYAELTFSKNYTGSIRKQFTILESGANIVYTAVTWQYYADGEWKTASSASEFPYCGTNQGGSVRALLTVEKIVGGGAANEVLGQEEVYSSAYLSTRRNHYILKFNDGNEFKNAATYTVTMSGSGNYAYDGVADSAKSITLAIKPLALDMESADFSSDTDGSDNKLWYFRYGNDSTANLIGGGISYVVKSGNSYVGKSGNTALGDVYARYRGMNLNLEYNENYSVNGKTLAEWIDWAEQYDDVASITVTHKKGDTQDDASLTGEPYVEYCITTTYTINFGNNYVLSDNTHSLTLRKVWYIVTIENALRNYDGTEASAPSALTYGLTYNALDSMRPEFGDVVYWTLSGNGITERTVAVKFVRTASSAVEQEFYEVTKNGENYSLGDKLSDENFGAFFKRLDVGSYTLRGYVPEYTVPSSVITLSQWWTSEESSVETLRNTAGTVFAAVRAEFAVSVAPYDISGANIDVRITAQQYSGKAIEPTKDIVATFDGPAFESELTLVYGTDFTVAFSNNVDVTDKAVAAISGKGNYTGTKNVEFGIIKTQNTWNVTPNIIRWMFGSFDRKVNLFRAEPVFGESEAIKFKISTDSDGLNVLNGLGEFYINSDGEVSAEIAAKLKALKAGTYYLTASLPGTNNYYDLAPHAMQFNVLRAINSWDITPTVQNWNEGKYTSLSELINLAARFSQNNAYHIVIKDTTDAQNVVYDSKENVDKLATAKVGVYTITVTVDGTDDYMPLEWTSTFRVLEKVGLPWWVTLIISLGSLLAAALVLFILWKKGVFQILTERIVVAIRTKASVEATIASVRAAKRMEEGRRTVAEFKEKERLKKLQAEGERIGTLIDNVSENIKKRNNDEK